MENTEESVRYCLYARKSSEAEEKQALSIDSQVKEMLQIAARDSLQVADIYKESHSAKDCGQRPVFSQMIEDIKSGKFSGILVWHPDRLSRNAGDLGSIVDLLDQKRLIEIRTYSQRFTNNPNEKFLLMILGSQAKLENDNKSINVKRGLKTRCEMGLWPSVAPTGYLNSKNVDQRCQVFPDPQRAPIIKEMFLKIGRDGWTGRKVYRWLKEIKFTSKNNKPISLSNIYTLLDTTFYYGMYEYPRGSGNWYQGKHEPIITKEIFEQARIKLKENISTERKPYNPDFAFTKLMRCGACGSGISAQRKYKKLSNGSVAEYIYYGCTRNKDIDCGERYIEEKELVSQLAGIIDQIDLDNSGIKKKLEAEIERHKKFHFGIMGKPEVEYKVEDVDIRNYAKYILTNGSIFEKRELVMYLKSNILLKNKRIYIK